MKLQYAPINLLQTRENNLKVYKMTVNKKDIDWSLFVLVKNAPGSIVGFCIAG